MNAFTDVLSSISLEDKYTRKNGRVYLNGSQALVRLMLLQAERDRLAGLHTAGFVSGYRGSPLGGVDQAFWAAQKHLDAACIKFQPGLNEDLGATSVWGSQQVNLFEGATVDGVFGMWYGKGPGVDRSVDVLKHANAAGTSAKGGVLLVAGDDHAAKSSTLPHQSDHVLKACMIPVLFPSNLQEYLDLGVLGYAMSRYAGVWVGFKAIGDVVESSASIEVDPERQKVILPLDFELPMGGLNIRWPDTPLDQEARLLDHKLYAALAFCRANRINHTVINSHQARFGIVASGKAYRDTLQALADLGLTPSVCQQLGIRLYKVGMVWPLDAVGIREFALGLQEILVVEEKRQMIEYQIKEELYAWRDEVRPKVYGKFDERASVDGLEGGEWSLPQGSWLLPTHYELDPALIAKAIAKRLSGFELTLDVQYTINKRLGEIAQRDEVSHPQHTTVERKPYFCSGCPHNTSTRVPEGSRAMAGIGCHYMVVWMNRSTETFTQMGGEGVTWIGQAPFTNTSHVFANLGDGTYFHSGVLAIRASVAAGVNITYKLLYNDAVAMTGGQHVDGSLTVPQLTRQLAAEGVARIVIVTDDVSRYPNLPVDDLLADGVRIYDRRELDAVQKELREIKGTTVLVYEQTCASEKRRRRKRVDPVTGSPLYPNPAKRVVINPRVCEGCGDCSKQSNCLSIEPLGTPWGTKRTINQSTCNKDYSCLEGLCPSLVTVEGAQLLPANFQHSELTLQALVQDLPLPEFHIKPEELSARYAVLINGIGGTGVVTIGAWLGMAAHIEGHEVLGLDMAGLAQKGGAVSSHLQFAPRGTEMAASKIPVGEADLLIGGDLLVSANPKTLELLKQEARVVLNTDTSPTADFIHNENWFAPEDLLNSDISAAVHMPAQHLLRVQAQRAAEQLLGDTVYANAYLLGVAWQKGWIPLHQESLLKAMQLNGVQVGKNTLAFGLGRCAAALPTRLAALLVEPTPASESPEDTFLRLRCELVAYQDEYLAVRFECLLNSLKSRFYEGGLGLTWLALCKAYFKLLAFKDEYEVARLHTDNTWLNSVHGQFEKGAHVVFHFAPPWLVSHKGLRPKKLRVSALWRPALRLLAHLKTIRGTWFDPFKNTVEKRNQHELATLFESWLELMQNEDYDLIGAAQQIDATLSLFNQVKGFGQVRVESFDRHINEISVAVAIKPTKK